MSILVLLLLVAATYALWVWVRHDSFSTHVPPPWFD